jgi:hypothetical protein
MYPPRPRPSIKEQEESGSRIVNVAMVVLWFAWGVIEVLGHHYSLYGALAFCNCALWTTTAIAERRGIPKQQRYRILLIELAILPVFVAAYLFLGRRMR